LVVAVSKRVLFLLEGIKKRHPSGLWPKNCEIISGMLHTVSFPPISDMQKSFKECEGVFFTVGKILDKEITL